MAQQPDFNAEQAAQDLLKKKLGELASWQIPPVVDVIGPYDLSPFEAYKSEIDKVRLDCEQLLNEFAEEDLCAIFDDRSEDAKEAMSMWLSHRRSKIHDLKKRPPDWFDGGFGHPDYAADFENWCKMPQFSIDEALSLATGIEPGHFSLKRLESMSREGLAQAEGPLRYLLIRYEQVKRRFGTHGIDSDLRPLDLLKWSQKVRFEMHPQFETLLRTYHGSEQQQPILPSVPGKKPDRREIESVAKLFTVMAIEHLGYRPEDAKSPITKEISDIAATMGISISDDTVRKYLKLGSRHILGDWKPE